MDAFENCFFCLYISLNCRLTIITIEACQIKVSERILVSGQIFLSHIELNTPGKGNSNPLQWQPTPVLFLENPMDGGAWWAAVHGVARSRTQLSDFTLFFHFHALEKEMATHSSVLAWKIPGTGEPGGLLSMGSHRVGHN